MQISDIKVGDKFRFDDFDVDASAVAGFTATVIGISYSNMMVRLSIPCCDGDFNGFLCKDEDDNINVTLTMLLKGTINTVTDITGHLVVINGETYSQFLERAEQEHQEHKKALEKNPSGGCFYLPHPIMVHSGEYWRCKHGSNAFWAKSCIKCMIRHPIAAWRWHHSESK